MSRDDLTSGDLLFHTLDGFDLSLLFCRLSNKQGPQSSSKKSLQASDSTTAVGKGLGRYYEDLFNLEYNSERLAQRQLKIQRQVYLRSLLRHYFEQKLQYLSRKLIKSINNRKNLYLLNIGRESLQLKRYLEKNLQAYDTIAFQAIIQYYSILQTELANAKEKLLHERYEKEIMKKQSLILRNILVFNCYVKIETKQSIELQLLAKTSAQFQRCMKAVFDNLGNQNHLTIYHPDVLAMAANQDLLIETPTSSSKTTSTKKKQGKPPQSSSSAASLNSGKNLIYTTLTEKNIKVLNIFKLKNSFIANNLQKIASKIPNAKMKGLFCCFPSDYLYNFSVYGVRQQQLFSSSSKAIASFTSDSKHLDYQRTNLAQYIDPSLLHSMTPADMFQANWLFAQQPEPLRPLAPDYVPLYQQSYHYAERMSSLDSSSSKSSNSSPPKQRFRFSKYSMISLMNEYSSEQLESGVFLALCRVLIVKQKTIQTMISDVDIIEALEQGYDAIFSSMNDEYCLLQESFILPEFLIHLSFPSIITSRIEELTSHQQEKESRSRAEDTCYQHLFSPYLQQQQKQQLLLNQRPKKKGTDIGSGIEGGMFCRSIEGEKDVKTIPDVMADNYFDFVEKLQNDQFKVEGFVDPVNLNQKIAVDPTDKDFSSQKNIMIKQSALLNIENSVKECQKSNHQLILSSSRRMVQFLSQLHLNEKIDDESQRNENDLNNNG